MGTDSGNNSLNTNRSSSSTGTASSKLSQPMESSFMEEDEEDYSENLKMSPEIRITKPQINKNIIEVRYRERSSTDAQSNRSPGSNQPSNQERRRSQHVNRLQITRVSYRYSFSKLYPSYPSVTKNAGAEKHAGE